MQRSTGTIRSQEKGINASRILQKQRTATSQRTGGALSSAHTSSGHKIVEKQKPKVLDENNVDVTPKPMFDTDQPTRARHGSALFHSIEGTSTPTDVMSNANGSILNTNAILTGATSFGQFPESSTTHVSSESNQVTHDYGSMHEPHEHREREHSALFFTNVVKKQDTSDDIYESLNLYETNTFCLLDIPATCISDEDPNLEIVKQKNQKYLELCKTKAGNDTFAERGMNTFNNLPKIKTTQTERIGINDKGVVCNLWDMYDSYEAVEKGTTIADLSREKSIVDPKSGEKTKSINKTKTSIGTATVVSELSAMPSENATEDKENKSNYQNSDNFKLNAFYMERLLNQNTYQPKQAKYRGMKPLSEDVPSKVAQQYDGLSLEKLWTYTSSLTKDRNVSCVSWNKKNKDVLAAGYGKFEFNDDQTGLVCCWCLKNPEFPERYYKTEAGVTALAFSQKHANLLAVGLFNGNINIYDVRNNNTTALISTNDSEHKHLSPVWHLKWTDRDRSNSSGEDDEMEVLMSISSDGRITQWMIRKGFESSDYLKLKRVMSKPGAANQKKEKDKSEGLVSRTTGGLCFDIWDEDKSIYLCGTEEGFIHRCSTSYNEQYLDTYEGHSGPVYKLAWSPFLKNCFLSASSDWTIKLWKSNRFSPCLSFNSTTKAVYDLCWSHKSATLFCCVNENAIELWDLSKSTLDPIYVSNSLNIIKLTSISYSPNSDSLVVGTSDGSLVVYGIKNLPPPKNDADLEDIIKQSLISQLENIKIDEEEAKDVIEKHQLDSLAAKPEEEDEESLKQKEKLDAFEKKLEKVKSQNAALLEGKNIKNNMDSSDSD